MTKDETNLRSGTRSTTNSSTACGRMSERSLSRQIRLLLILRRILLRRGSQWKCGADFGGWENGGDLKSLRIDGRCHGFAIAGHANHVVFYILPRMPLAQPNIPRAGYKSLKSCCNKEQYPSGTLTPPSQQPLHPLPNATP
jgi:hypothetical protein